MFGVSHNGSRWLVRLDIAASRSNVNLLSDLTALLGTSPNYAMTAHVVIQPSVIISSTSTGSYAFDCRNLPAGSDVILEMKTGSYVVGKGGAGGAHTTASGSAGGAGGPAFITDKPTRIIGSGTIGGGGGGGAGGRRPYRGWNYNNTYGQEFGDNDWQCRTVLVSTGGAYANGGGGGGGAGYGSGGGGNSGGNGALTSGGNGGSTSGVPASPTPTSFQCQQGYIGTQIANEYWYQTTSTVGGFNGGPGGSLGNSGNLNGGSSGTGGAAGIAITGYSNCTIGDGISVLVNTTG